MDAQTRKMGLLALGITFGAAAAITGIVLLANANKGGSGAGASGQSGSRGAGPGTSFPLRNPEAGRGSGSSSPTAAVERPSDEDGLKWNHQDLIAFLKAKGVPIKDAVPSNIGAIQGPAMLVFRNFEATPGSGSNGGTAADQLFSIGRQDGTCYIQLRRTAQDARDQAGVVGWSWGRFLFAGDPVYLAEIRKAITG